MCVRAHKYRLHVCEPGVSHEFAAAYVLEILQPAYFLLICRLPPAQVEMWLVAPDDLRIPNTDITIAAGERVLLEVSRKFTQPRLRAMAFSSGWCWQVCVVISIASIWHDSSQTEWLQNGFS